MSRRPLVSVWIPALNRARFLPEAIESVLAQTYHNIELIIVDDGSTDGSLEIAQGYAVRYRGRVKVYTHEGHSRRGVSATLNLAYLRSDGDYLCGLGADDAFLPNKVERQVMFLDRRRDVGLLYGRMVTIDERGRVLGQVVGKDFSRQRDPLPRLLEGNCITAPTFMVRRECLEKVGLHDESLVYSDWELWIRIVAHYKLGFLAQPLTYYRIHATNTSVGQPPEVQRERHLEVMTALGRKAPMVGGALGRPFARALMELQLAYLYFCAGDLSAAAQAIKSASEIDPSMLRNGRFLAGWLFRRRGEMAAFTRSPARDFLPWFAEQASQILSLESADVGRAGSSLRRWHLRGAVLLAKYGVAARHLGGRAWHRLRRHSAPALAGGPVVAGPRTPDRSDVPRCPGP